MVLGANYLRLDFLLSWFLSWFSSWLISNLDSRLRRRFLGDGGQVGAQEPGFRSMAARNANLASSRIKICQTDHVVVAPVLLGAVPCVSNSCRLVARVR